MRILFLDDERARHRHILDAVKGTDATVVAAYGASEAIQALEKSEFDLIMLDHDLGESENGREVAGIDVCQRICEMAPRHQNASFVIHSLNPPGASNMLRCLRRAGFDAHAIPHAWLMLEKGENGWIINQKKSV